MKYEHLKFIVSRFDLYYNNINNKGAFYIGLNTFIFGGLCVGYTNLYNKVNCGFLIWIILSVLLLSCWLSILFTIIAIKPYTKDNFANEDLTSIMYFGGIARHELSFFKDKIAIQNEESILEDITLQGHSLAKGLSKKFTKLKWASHFLIIQFFIVTIIFPNRQKS